MLGVGVVCRASICRAAGGPQDADEKGDHNDGDDHERGSDIHLQNSLPLEYQSPGRLPRFPTLDRPGPWIYGLLYLGLTSFHPSDGGHYHQGAHHVMLFVFQDVAVPYIFVAAL